MLDLGSGAGVDGLISAKRVGATGKAIGLDTTDEMLRLARANAAQRLIELVYQQIAAAWARAPSRYGEAAGDGEVTDHSEVDDIHSRSVLVLKRDADD